MSRRKHESAHDTLGDLVQKVRAKADEISKPHNASAYVTLCTEGNNIIGHLAGSSGGVEFSRRDGFGSSATVIRESSEFFRIAEDDLNRKFKFVVEIKLTLKV